jgi:L-iditol 2-dehydrogenase
MLKAPCPFGHEFAGTVVEVGLDPAGSSEKPRWAPGDRVVVANSAPCGACDYCAEGRENLCTDLDYVNGAFAEYILAPRRFAERNTHAVPEGVPFELAALTEPLACVLHGVDCCDLAGPCDIAVYGAGPIGLLFVGALASSGHRVVLADLSAPRLRTGEAMGAAGTVQIGAGGGQAGSVRALARRAAGYDVAIDATGVPEVWADAIATVRPGGIANLFGGCAPGTTVPLDTHLVHYSELTIKGVYHHRPATVARALKMLASGAFPARLLLSVERPLEDLEGALRSMMRGEALKVVIRP